MKDSETRNTHSLISINLRGIFAALAFIICLLAAQQASAADYVVTRVDDRNNATCAAGDCSLREAVTAANATSDADTISFNIPAASCNASTNVCTITLTTESGGEIPIERTGALTINGTGANRLTIDGGAGTNRIFSIFQTNVKITGITLTGGNGSGLRFNGSGGAIYVGGGSLLLDSVHITANSAQQFSNGGGIYFLSGTNHQILNSTFSDNISVNDCGGFFSDLNQGTLSVINSTISGNTARGLGGGFCDNGNTTLRSVTITGNTLSGLNASGGGIIKVGGGTLNLGNTIVAGNTGGTRPDISIDTGAVTTSGYNLIGNNLSVEAIFPEGNPNANNDIVGTSDAPVDPMLEALDDNGGTTPTHKLMSTSPAIDKGFSFGSTTDQRGLTRPADNLNITNAAGGDGSDIGAFELQLTLTAASVSISGRARTTSGRGIGGVQITLTDSSGSVRTATTSSFGYYRFEDAAAGETYVLTAKGKRFAFDQPTQVINADADIADANFIAY